MARVLRESLGRYDAVFVSPTPTGALFSCLARVQDERAHGSSVLVAVAFETGEPDTEATAALDALGVDVVGLGFTPAAARDARLASLRAALAEPHDGDAGLLGELRDRLNDLAVRTGCRDVYLPLGAGGHVDDRLCHAAGLLALAQPRGRSVFLYEERPAIFVPGAVRIRLCQLAARLPPGAADVRDQAGLARVLLRFNQAPHVRAGLGGLVERARATRQLAADWRAARAWRPLKALGLRLQPVLQRASGSGLGDALAALSRCEASVAALFGSRERMLARAREHARRLGGEDYLERYWLLLPERTEGGLERAPSDVERLVS
ncbi:MAG: hypothetical protein AB7O37_18420 [Vicinamibacteria bacterium]